MDGRWRSARANWRAARPRRPPVLVAVAEIEVAERAADGDRADVDGIAEIFGLGLKGVEGAAELQLLAFDPFRPAPLFGRRKVS